MGIGARWRYIAVLVFFTGCGYVGDPLPPALNIPLAVSDLRAIERGDRIVIEFTVPQATTEGLKMDKPGAIDLRAGAPTAPPAEAGQWAATADPVEVVAPESGSMRVETAAAKWVGQEVVFGVRIAHRKGRWSDWSNLARLRVVPALSPPESLTAESAPTGVRLRWRLAEARAGAATRIWRTAPGQQGPVAAVTVEGTEWLDADARYGETYTYSAQSVLQAGGAAAESLMPEAVSITPEDRFPPAVPTGLTVVAGLGTVELAWDRNREPDLAGYRVYRAGGESAFEKVADSLDTPSYSDREIGSGKRYRYAISSVDQLGNESAPSTSVELTVP